MKPLYWVISGCLILVAVLTVRLTRSPTLPPRWIVEDGDTCHASNFTNGTHRVFSGLDEAREAVEGRTLPYIICGERGGTLWVHAPIGTPDNVLKTGKSK